MREQRPQHAHWIAENLDSIPPTRKVRRTVLSFVCMEDRRPVPGRPNNFVSSSGGGPDFCENNVRNMLTGSQKISTPSLRHEKCDGPYSVDSLTKSAKEMKHKLSSSAMTVEDKVKNIYADKVATFFENIPVDRFEEFVGLNVGAFSKTKFVRW